MSVSRFLWFFTFFVVYLAQEVEQDGDYLDEQPLAEASSFLATKGTTLETSVVKVGYLKKYVTPNVMSGIITVVFMLVILSCALGCLLNLKVSEVYMKYDCKFPKCCST